MSTKLLSSREFRWIPIDFENGVFANSWIYFGELNWIRCTSQIMGYTGINYSSPTLASAISNLVPAFTFILALLFRFFFSPTSSFLSPSIFWFQLQNMGSLEFPWNSIFKLSLSIGVRIIICYWNEQIINYHALFHQQSQGKWFLHFFFLRLFLPLFSYNDEIVLRIKKYI